LRVPGGVDRAPPSGAARADARDLHAPQQLVGRWYGVLFPVDSWQDQFRAAQRDVDCNFDLLTTLTGRSECYLQLLWLGIAGEERRWQTEMPVNDNDDCELAAYRCGAATSPI
jgi:hypothetical protein